MSNWVGKNAARAGLCVAAMAVFGAAPLQASMMEGDGKGPTIATGPAAPGPLAAPPSALQDPYRVLDSFDIYELRILLGELNIASDIKTARNGRRYLQAAYGAKLIFEIIPAACLGPDGDRCLGANFLARFKGEAPNPQMVTAFNRSFAFSTVGVMPDGGAYVSRYEIADFGAPRGNVASSLESFIYIAELFRKELETSGATVATVGYAEDQAARRLNRTVSEDFGVVTAVSPSRKALHQIAMEEAPVFVDLLNSEDETPHNKIRNLSR